MFLFATLHRRAAKFKVIMCVHAVSQDPSLLQGGQTCDHNRLLSGMFGQTAKFGQPPCLFHSSVIGIKNKLTK